jgi:hypothetical protein
VREVRLSEQAAYQLLQFLTRYWTDVGQLLALWHDREALKGYIEAMEEHDRPDAERLAHILEQALEVVTKE